MPQDIGLTIPFNSKNRTEENIKQTSERTAVIERTLLSWFNISTKKAKINFEKNKKFLTELLTPVMPTSEDEFAKKKRNKLIDHYEKHIIKNKFFPMLVSGIKTITKKLASLAENWFLKFLAFLIGMAIFDPKGKMLTGIVKVLGKALRWAVDLLVKWIPIIIVRIINLLSTILPQVFSTLLRSIFPSMSKETADIFGNVFSVLSTGFFILGGILKLAKPLMSVFKIIKSVGSGLISMASFLLANPIVLIILAVVGALAALYIWGEKISKWATSALKWINNLGKSTSFLNRILYGILAPFKFFIAGIRDLANFFVFVKKFGLKNVLKFVWEVLKQTGRNIKTFFTKTIPDFFINGIKSLASKIKNIFSDIVKWFSELFHGIVDWLVTVATNPVSYFRATNEQQAGMIKITQIAREAGVDRSKLMDIAKGDINKSEITDVKEKALYKDLFNILKNKETAKTLTEEKTQKVITKVQKLKSNDIDNTIKDLGKGR